MTVNIIQLNARISKPRLAVENVEDRYELDLRIAGETGLLYLMTPYSRWPNRPRAAAAAAKLAAYLVNQGYVGVFSPIVHSHYFCRWVTHDARDSAWWCQLQRPFMEMSRGAVIGTLLGWQESSGIKSEIAYFKEHQLPIAYLNPVTYELTEKPT